jgi:Zn-dependent peptidase ImmA (M78 family)
MEARLNLLRMHASLLYEEISLSTTLRMSTFDPLEVSPQDAARLVRMQWRMPSGPVRQSIQWVESAGCLVVEEDFGTPRIDGLSQWVSDHPIILLNERAPTDRKRLTVAHELGHLVLHSADVTPYLELEATQFAAEFLMPSETIRPKLRNLTLGRLMDLKREWGVSIQALIERAYSLDVLSNTQRVGLYKSLGARGWRTREPVSDELPAEVPALVNDIAAAIAARGFNADETAKLAGWTEAGGNHVFVPRAQGLKLVP